MYLYRRKRSFIFLLLAVAGLGVNGCGFRTSHPVKMRTSTAALKDASLDQLVQSINSNAARLSSLKASVDIDSSVLEQKKEKVTDNPQIAGYILMRKPEMLRMIGLVPVVRSRMFDMVSNGTKFELAIPVKNKFIVGSNRQPPKPSP